MPLRSLLTPLLLPIALAGAPLAQCGGDDDDDTPDTTPVINDCAVFPPDNAWNTDVSDHPVHVNSEAFLASIGFDEYLHPDFGTVWQGAPIGIPFVYVTADQPLVPINFTLYGNESDPGPYPVPADAPIEGGSNSNGDRHVLVLETDSCMLYEMYRAFPMDDGSWSAGCGAVWDLSSNALRPEGWTSADAAGLPIFPGLVRYEEVVEEGVIDHALRFTVEASQRGYIYPATHYASDDTNPDLPPMGLRLRMKADYDCSGYSAEAQVICTALKKYGMLMADNGGDLFISGAPDDRWNDDALGDLKLIPTSALEVVYTGEIITEAP